MSRRRAVSLASLAVVVAVGVVPVASLAAQSKVPSVTLSQPEVELEETFDRISGLRELRDGRVVVTDVLAKSVALADFKAGTVTRIGREGSGPNEYQFPRSLVALPGDTTLIVDAMQRRFLRVLPDGTPNGTIAWPNEMGGVATVKGADQQGRIYFQGSAFNFGGGGGPAEITDRVPDTVPVLRWDRKTQKVDTIARIKGPNLGINVTGGQNRRSVMIRSQPWSPQDDWGVTSQGAVGIARVGDYHVDWISPARQVTSGGKVPFTKVKVTEADREEFLRRMRDPRGRMMVSRGGGPPPGTRPPQAAEPQVDFPSEKPPFVEQSAMVTPDGQLWVRRSATVGTPTTYDVFDATGKHLRQVVLPKSASVAGFGNGTVYVTRTDEDDLVYLGRYRRP